MNAGKKEPEKRTVSVETIVNKLQKKLSDDAESHCQKVHSIRAEHDELIAKLWDDCQKKIASLYQDFAGDAQKAQLEVTQACEPRDWEKKVGEWQRTVAQLQKNYEDNKNKLLQEASAEAEKVHKDCQEKQSAEQTRQQQNQMTMHRDYLRSLKEIWDSTINADPVEPQLLASLAQGVQLAAQHGAGLHQH